MFYFGIFNKLKFTGTLLKLNCKVYETVLQTNLLYTFMLKLHCCFAFLDIEYFLEQQSSENTNMVAGDTTQNDQQQTSVIMAPSEYHSLCLKLQSANERADSAETDLQRAMLDLQKMRLENSLFIYIFVLWKGQGQIVKVN